MTIKLPSLILSGLMILTFSSCKKEEVPVIESEKREAGSDRPFYFLADIDDAKSSMSLQWDEEDVVFHYSNKTIFHENQNCVAPGTMITTGQGKFDSPYVGFLYYCYDHKNESADAFFSRMFNASDQPYYSFYNADGSENIHDGGVVISINDSAGVEWSSKWGDQTGSTFTIIDSERTLEEEGRVMQKVHADFNCMLYDNKGNSKKLLNGKFYFPYEKMFD